MDRGRHASLRDTVRWEVEMELGDDIVNQNMDD
jgi:hypothetical protein